MAGVRRVLLLTGPVVTFIRGPPPRSHASARVLGDISCPVSVSSASGLVPVTGEEDAVDMQLRVLIFGSGPVDNLNFSRSPASLVFHDPGSIILHSHKCDLFPRDVYPACGHPGLQPN